MKYRLTFIILTFVLITALFSSKEALAAPDTENPSSDLEYATLEDLKDARKIAIKMGAFFEPKIKELYPNVEVVYYSTPIDCSIALQKEKVDAVVHDSPTLRYISATMDGLSVMPEYIMEDNYHFVFSKSDFGEKIRDEFNEWLVTENDSGRIDEMINFWCGDEEPESDYNFYELPDINGTIKVGIDSTGRPDVYFRNNMPTGYPIEVIYRFCKDRGYKPQPVIINFDAMVASLSSGKIDVLPGFISFTEERAKSILYSDTVMEAGIAVLVRSKSSDEKAGIIDAIKAGFIKTFVTEDRYKLIIRGFELTLAITLGGFILANILGALFCAMNLSKNRILRVIAGAYNRIMQGTPMVVILMFLYYVIFGSSDISGVIVSMVAFGLTSGANLAQIFVGAINGVDKQQTEAALALGFTRPSAFIGIVLPQAARIALSGYFTELIGLMKGTAIVGYIAVSDLTKAGDIIRSSTFDAIFPLLAIALIYFLIAFVILSILKRIRNMLAPKRRHSVNKEVKG